MPKMVVIFGGGEEDSSERENEVTVGEKMLLTSSHDD